METLRMTSPDLTAANIEKIAELFPSVVTESRDEDGNLHRAIDFDLLRQELSPEIVEGPQERYQLDWPGKRAALFAANAPIAKTLRPDRDESVDFDTTKNLFIDGDNLDVLKLLQESYLGKVKLIYIDPPYNTGNDFVYNDDFAESTEEYLARSGQVDEGGSRLIANPESSGRYHSDWLSMMYPRLRLARNLLSEAGSIFVSCDYHESGNLRCLLDEVFGASNLVAEFIWQHSIQPKGYTDTASVHHNTVYCYQRGANFSLRPLERTAEHNRNYRNPDDDPRGPWRPGDVRNALYRPNLRYTLATPSGRAIEPPANGWRWSKETMAEKIASGEVVFNADETAITRKIYLDTVGGRAVETLWLGKEVGTTREAASELKQLFDGETPFDTPKPMKLMQRIMWIGGVDDGDTVLDFFAGSGTTAHAVMAQNAEDGGARQFILVQLDEPMDRAAKGAAYESIAAVARERVRRAGRAIRDSAGLTGESLDIGFRALRLDTSNRNDLFRTPEESDQTSLDSLEGSVKADRSAEDLLFQVLLEWGLDISLPIATESIEGHGVYIVDDGVLMACLEPSVGPNLIEQIARRQPLRAVFLDYGFRDDAARINAQQIFRELSPSTDIKVI